VVRVHTPAIEDNITLSLSNQAGGDAGGLMPLGGGQPSSSMPLTANCPDPDGGGGLAFALYRAPLDFAGTVAQLTQSARTVQLSAVTASGAQAQVDVGIVRPPVVLVHGYATNSDLTWKDFEPFDGLNTSLVRTYRADYGGTFGLFSFVEATTPTTTPNELPDIRRSHLGFSWNQPDVASQVRSYISEYKEGDNSLSAPVAAVQADVVAHSMGGLVVKYWTAQRRAYLAPETFGQGFVHKIITLGTPHFGSPQAIVMLDPTGAVCSRANGAAVERFAFSRATLVKLVTGGTIYANAPGAVGELSGDGVGSYLSSALEETVAKAWPVPTAMLGGDVTPVLPNLEFNPFAWGLRLSCIGDVLADRYTPNLFSTIFDSSIRPGNMVGNAVPTASDGSVPLTSAFRDPSFTVCSGPLCAAGAAHGANTALFFLPSYSHLLDRTRTMSLLVEGLLNLPANDARWKR
jgi:pimeloyl-ACP methyl ester carboxylesterase